MPNLVGNNTCSPCPGVRWINCDNFLIAIAGTTSTRSAFHDSPFITLQLRQLFLQGRRLVCGFASLVVEVLEHSVGGRFSFLCLCLFCLLLVPCGLSVCKLVLLAVQPTLQSLLTAVGARWRCHGALSLGCL